MCYHNSSTQETGAGPAGNRLPAPAAQWVKQRKKVNKMELNFFATLQRVLVLFLLIVIGFAAGRTGLVSEKGQSDLTNLVLYVTMPATIFKAMQLPFERERIQTALQIIAIMLLVYAFMYLVGRLYTHFLSASPADKDLIRAALLLSNTSFMGYPMVQSLLGEEALFYAVVGAGFLFELVSWSLGIYLVSRRGKGTGFNWKKVVFSPGILAALAGLVFFVGQWPLIPPLQSVIDSLAPATSPLAMMVVGLMLSRSNVRDCFANKPVYGICLVKLLVIPLSLVLALRLCGLDGPRLVIPTLMVSTPTASYVAMFAGNADNNPLLASQIVFMTSLFSILTIPLISLLL